MTGPHSGAPPGNESRPWQGGSRDITDAHIVTDDGDGLLDHHKDLLDARAISPAVARDRGYSSTMLPGWLRQQRFSVAVSKLIPGLVIPVYDVHGDLAFHQYRPDKPRVRAGKVAKYELPVGVRMVLDVPRSINGKLADPTVPLFITESPTKADAAVSIGLVCIAMLGVYGWRGSRTRGGTTALPDFEYVALNGRTVYLVPDSDVVTNPPGRKRGWPSRRATREPRRGRAVRVPASSSGWPQGWAGRLLRQGGHGRRAVSARRRRATRETRGYARRPTAERATCRTPDKPGRSRRRLPQMAAPPRTT